MPPAKRTEQPGAPPINGARPKISTTLGAVAAMRPVLDRLLTIQVSAATAYRLARLHRAVAPEMQHFEERRDALIRELGHEREPTPDERARGATSIHEVTPANLTTFQERMKELADVAIDLDARPLSFAEFQTLPVSGGDVLLLDPLIEPPPEA